MAPHVVCDAPHPAPWEWVETVRQCVETGLSDQDEVLRYAALLAASELAENIVKYGEPCSSACAGIAVDVDEEMLRVRSVNCVGDPADAHAVIAIVEDIARAPNPEELYMLQMEEVMREERPGSRLGFYRMAAECGLRLSHHYADGCLTITAEREVS